MGDNEHVSAADTCEVNFVPIDGEYIDDITSLPLDPALVHQGRLDEPRGFDSRGVYTVRSRSWAKSNGIPILGNRCVHRMKGDVVRSRFVAQDFNHTKGKQGPDELFASPVAAPVDDPRLRKGILEQSHGERCLHRAVI